MELIALTPFTLDIAKAALLIFTLRTIDVSLGTMRLIMIAHGRRNRAAALGFLEVTVWIIAVGRVMGDISNIWMILAYSLGYAFGTYAGIWIENRFADGSVLLRITSAKRGSQIINTLKEKGMKTIQFQGISPEGSVDVVSTTLERRHLDSMLHSLRRIDGSANLIVEDLRFSAAGKTAR